MHCGRVLGREEEIGKLVDGDLVERQRVSTFTAPTSTMSWPSATGYGWCYRSIAQSLNGTFWRRCKSGAERHLWPCGKSAERSTVVHCESRKEGLQVAMFISSYSGLGVIRTLPVLGRHINLLRIGRLASRTVSMSARK